MPALPPIAIVISVVVCVAVLVIPFLFISNTKALSADSGWKLMGAALSSREPFAGQMKQAAKGNVGGQGFGGDSQPTLLYNASEQGLRLSHSGGDLNKFDYPDLLIPWKAFTYYSATADGVKLIVGEYSARIDISASGLSDEVARFMRMNS